MKNTKRAFNLSPLTILIILTIIASVATVIYLILTGNTDQVFTDIVVERIAYYQSNKSVEMILYYGLILIGMALFAFLFFKFCKTPSFIDSKKDYDFGYIFLLIVCAITVTRYFFYQTIYPVQGFAIVLGLIMLLFDRTLLTNGLVFFYMAVYGFIGLYRFYAAIANVPLDISIWEISILAAVLTITLLIFKQRKKYLYYGSLVAQLPIPFIFMILIMNTHLYSNTYIDIPVPQRARIFIYSLIIICLLSTGYMIIKNHNKPEHSVPSAISLGTCISIACTSFFNANGFVISSDLHHPAENIIGYSQIFTHGQSAYSEYIPPSGLYSVVGGFFMQFFGNDMMTNYNLIMNLMYVTFTVITVVLLNKHVKREWLFLIVTFFILSGSSRIILILPIMLLLTLPSLRKMPKAWLCTWFFTTYLHGLYYPLYGAAVGVAFLPLGILQLARAIKEFKSNKKSRIYFIVCVSICLLSVIPGLSLLIGTLKHTLAMSGQTIYADGISIFGQRVPNSFLPQLIGTTDISFIRLALWDVLRFLIPAVIVWIAFGLLCIYLREFKNKHVTKEHLCISGALVIMPVISYSYGLVRMDNNVLSVRAALPISFTIIFIILIFTQITMNKYAVQILLVLFCLSTLNTQEKDPEQFQVLLQPNYSVTEDYTYISTSQYHLGTGFINKTTYDSLVNVYIPKKNTLDYSLSYLCVFPSFGYTYAYDLNGASLIEPGTIKGYEAAQETINLLRKEKPLVGRSLLPFENYYLYNYLMTSGEYLYDSTLRLFLPNNDNPEYKTTKQYNSQVDIAKENYDLGKYASSLGSSIETLLPIFTVSDIDFTSYFTDTEYVFKFENRFDERDFDYIYIDFDTDLSNYTYTLYEAGIEYELTADKLATNLMKKNYNPNQDVVVTYDDETGTTHSIRCALSKGKILIPLGAGANYLLNNHTTLSFHLEYQDTVIRLPKVNEIKLLKVREIE